MSSTINFAGAGSGLDVNAIITALMSSESSTLTTFQSKQQNINAATSTLSSFSSNLSSLQSAARALNSTTGFSSYAATSSSPAIVATATGAATTGAYSLTVNALAREQRTYSTTQSSSTTALGMTGTLGLTIGSGSPFHVSVASTDTLTDIATKISSSGARVSASVIYTGSAYTLQVRGLDTGAANAITFGESGFSLGLSTPANTVQSAQDASLTLDGMTITRATNQVQGVIPGVTLALTNTTTGSPPVAINVSPDGTSLKTKIRTFVTAYNSVITSGHAAAGYGSQAASNPILAGDSTIRGAMDKLATIMDSAVPGTTGAYSSLGTVGLSANNDGSLTLNTAKFDAALAADPTSVAKLFITDTSTGATGVMDTFSKLVDTLTLDPTSPIRSEMDSYSSESRNLTDEITREQSRLTAYQATLRTQFANLDAQVSKYKSIQAAMPTTTTTSTG